MKGSEIVPRYIDTEIIAKIVFDYWKECEQIERIIPAIKRAIIYNSTDDVVKVVRCKDCKHRIFDHGFYACDLDTWDFHERGRNAEDDNWFCADGEKEITGKAGEKEKRI